MADETVRVSSQGLQDGESQRFRLAAAALPVVLGFGLALIVILVVAVVLLFDRVGDLEVENRSLGTLFETNILQLQQSVLQQRTISYWLAYPGPQTLVLNTPFEGGVAQGLLKPAEEGMSAILLVAGLGELPPSSTYDIWLSEGERTVHAGELALDAAGWGTATIYPSEPLFTFERVQLTLRTQDNPGSGIRDARIVLEGLIR